MLEQMRGLATPAIDEDLGPCSVKRIMDLAEEMEYEGNSILSPDAGELEMQFSEMIRDFPSERAYLLNFLPKRSPIFDIWSNKPIDVRGRFFFRNKPIGTKRRVIALGACDRSPHDSINK
jgi:hypothetical protein